MVIPGGKLPVGIDQVTGGVPPLVLNCTWYATLSVASGIVAGEMLRDVGRTSSEKSAAHPAYDVFSSCNTTSKWPGAVGVPTTCPLLSCSPGGNNPTRSHS